MTSRGGTHPHRSRPSFLARVATDDAAQLDRRSSVHTLAQQRLHDSPIAEGLLEEEIYLTATRQQAPSQLLPRPVTRPNRGEVSNGWRKWQASRSSPSREQEPLLPGHTTRIYAASEFGRRPSKPDGGPTIRDKPILLAPEKNSKLGTFSGVFVPTTLNVLSILMFLRFGFILGQSGVVGMLGKSVAALEDCHHPLKIDGYCILCH